MNLIIFALYLKEYMETSVCIEQKGTVEEITSRNIKVKIRREASCGHCNARSMCYVGEGTDRIIEISNFENGLKVGDEVGVLITRSMGNKAVFLGYLVPLFILISALLVFDLLGIREWITGLASITILVPYFLLLYILRDRLRKTFSLSARKNEN